MSNKASLGEGVSVERSGELLILTGAPIVFHNPRHQIILTPKALAALNEFVRLTSEPDAVVTPAEAQP